MKPFIRYALIASSLSLLVEPLTGHAWMRIGNKRPRPSAETRQCPLMVVGEKYVIEIPRYARISRETLSNKRCAPPRLTHETKSALNDLEKQGKEWKFTYAYDGDWTIEISDAHGNTHEKIRPEETAFTLLKIDSRGLARIQYPGREIELTLGCALLSEAPRCMTFGSLGQVCIGDRIPYEKYRAAIGRPTAAYPYDSAHEEVRSRVGKALAIDMDANWTSDTSSNITGYYEVLHLVKNEDSYVKFKPVLKYDFRGKKFQWSPVQRDRNGIPTNGWKQHYSESPEYHHAGKLSEEPIYVHQYHLEKD